MVRIVKLYFYVNKRDVVQLPPNTNVANTNKYSLHSATYAIVVAVTAIADFTIDIVLFFRENKTYVNFLVLDVLWMK